MWQFESRQAEWNVKIKQVDLLNDGIQKKKKKHTKALACYQNFTMKTYLFLFRFVLFFYACQNSKTLQHFPPVLLAWLHFW